MSNASISHSPQSDDARRALGGLPIYDRAAFVRGRNGSAICAAGRRREQTSEVGWRPGGCGRWPARELRRFGGGYGGCDEDHCAGWGAQRRAGRRGEHGKRGDGQTFDGVIHRVFLTICAHDARLQEAP